MGKKASAAILFNFNPQIFAACLQYDLLMNQSMKALILFVNICGVTSGVFTFSISCCTVHAGATVLGALAATLLMNLYAN